MTFDSTSSGFAAEHYSLPPHISPRALHEYSRAGIL